MIVLNFLSGFHFKKSVIITSSLFINKFSRSSSLNSNDVIWLLYPRSFIAFAKFPQPAEGSSTPPALILWWSKRLFITVIGV